MARGLAELAAVPTSRRDRLLPSVAAWLEPGRDLSAADHVASVEHLSTVASRLTRESDHLDLVIAPTLGDHRFAAEAFGPDPDAPLLLHANYTAWFNQTGQPAVTLPMGTSATGLPLGVQLAGRRGTDALVLGVARWLEQTLEVALDFPDLTLPDDDGAAR